MGRTMPRRYVRRWADHSLVRICDLVLADIDVAKVEARHCQHHHARRICGRALPWRLKKGEGEGEGDGGDALRIRAEMQSVQQHTAAVLVSAVVV